MKKRIWLKVEGVKLEEVKIKKLGESAELTVSAGLTGFRITGLSLNKSGDHKFLNVFGSSSMRFIDVPGLHRGCKPPKRLLENIVLEAIHDGFVAGTADKGASLFTHEPQFKEGFFKPANWNRSSLRIPIDLVKISEFICQSSDGPVRACIRLGDHLVFNYEIVYERWYDGGIKHLGYRGQNIKDKKVIAVIDNLLKSEGSDFIPFLSSCGTSELNRALVDITDDYKGGPPPPVRFY